MSRHTRRTVPAEMLTDVACHLLTAPVTTQRRTKRHCEAPEVGAMARRVLRALVRRTGDGDTEALEQLRQLCRDADDALVAGARAQHEFGYSWTEIGRTLGVTRQTARERFADSVRKESRP